MREMPNKDIIIHTTNWLVPAAGGLLNPNTKRRCFMSRDGSLAEITVLRGATYILDSLRNLFAVYVIGLKAYRVSIRART